MCRPVHQDQGPADNCVIGGKNLGWLSCTAYAAAMALDAATCGRVRVSGCSIRRRTGDTTGGLMLSQVEPIIESYGVPVRRKTGSDYATAAYLAGRLAKKHPAIIQGNAGALIGTVNQSTAGYVNHAVAASGEAQQWRTVNGLYRPDYVLIDDPAADGRLDFAQGPQWWQWGTVLRFAGMLRPNGDDTPGTIGYGRMFAAFLTPERTARFRAHVAAGSSFWMYTLQGDYIVSRSKERTANGFSAPAEAPRSYRVHSSVADQFPQRSYTLSELLQPSSRAGYFLGAQYVTEV